MADSVILLFMYANEWQGKNYYCNGDPQWQPMPIAIPRVVFSTLLICIHLKQKKTESATAGMKISGGLQQNSGDELKLYLSRTGSTLH